MLAFHTTQRLRTGSTIGASIVDAARALQKYPAEVAMAASHKLPTSSNMVG